MLYALQYHNKSNSFHYGGGGGFYPGGDLNMDVFFCLLTGIWACNCGVGGLGAYGGGGAYRQ